MKDPDIQRKATADMTKYPAGSGVQSVPSGAPDPKFQVGHPDGYDASTNMATYRAPKQPVTPAAVKRSK